MSNANINKPRATFNFEEALPTSTSNSDKVKAKIWINVEVDIGGKLYSLPFGLALDTMPDIKDNIDPKTSVGKANITRNALRKKLVQSIEAKLDDTGVLSNMVVTYRRVSTTENSVISTEAIDNLTF